MVIFDPPHIVGEKTKKLCGLQMKYGYLPKDNWKPMIKLGIAELFRILKPNGIFIFKWCETNIKIEDVLKLFPYKPLFGTNTKAKGWHGNYWIVFIKHRFEKQLK